MPSLSQVHRPKQFADVTGQSPVTETLRKEVATGKLGHAFLFCGPRGVGKTTTARILAKALNCEHPKDGEPDNTCASCAAANAGKQLDLIEMDAATHNGVDDMRELIEHVRFAPLGGKRKVYVLDEAHMLTGPAWNALLKTLEEPPAYAFFIFATTEWHKIPATIVSRCQRFEFRRIPEDLLAARVKEVAKEEEIKIDEDVVNLIVSRADGCVRDAETLLGQLASVGGKRLTLDVASLVVPQGYRDLASNLMSLWAAHDHAAAMTEAKRLADDGVPLIPFFDDLIEEVRRLLIASADPSKPQPFSPGELNDLALLLFERRKDAKSGVDPLFALQLAGTIASNGLLRHSKNENRTTNDDPKAESKIKTQLEPKKEIAAPPPAPRKDETPPVVASEAKQAQPMASSTLDLNMVRMKWAAIVRKVDEANHSLPFILKISRPESLRGQAVVLRFQYPFHLDKIVTDPKNRHIVEQAMRDVLGDASVTLEGVVGEDPGRAEERSQDIVSNILKAFGGSVVES
ncbi:MAG TPA: DNA polymerase III subunit gamma/tau [Verrucomicrobiae bacterium]|nr:DNA polymerase III subunit gamma/tau [Verrucomicrobiae bacterium]